jgi:hypothetical protein
MVWTLFEVRFYLEINVITDSAHLSFGTMGLLATLPETAVI